MDSHDNNNTNNHTILSQIQQNVNLQINRQKMEQLASKRIEIQTALDYIMINKEGKKKNDDDDDDDDMDNKNNIGGISTSSRSNNNNHNDRCYYYYMPSWNNSTNNQQDHDEKEGDNDNITLSSMFLMEKEDVQNMLQQKLQQVELDLIQVCTDVQSNMDTLNKKRYY